MRWSPWILVGSALVLGGVLLTFAAYRSTLQADRNRVLGKGTVVPSPWGALEYLEGGEGPPVLLIHGGGGGFDQGALMAEVLLGDGFRWIAPSRFGYLGSAAPDDARPGAQAHAFAWLLDELEVDRVAVVALSAGGPSGLLFALLYPERVTSLTLVAAGVVRVAADEQAAADWRGRMLVRLFSRDFPYWAVTSLFEGRFMQIMGADREVIADLSAEEKEWVRRLIDEMRPASFRSEGARLDNIAPLPGERIAGIRAPTLIVHAEDDRLQLFENARFAEATIPDARLLRFDRGGHLVMIVEQPVVRAAVREHLRAHADPSTLTLTEPDMFELEMADDLPDPARRFLVQAIAPGTPLARSVELEMRGTLRLAPDRDPVPFVADQLLAPPEQFVWRARTTGGLMRIRGFDRYADGVGEMRWRLWGIVPVVRAEGPDVTRSAAGRLAMEAILVPSTLLPGRGVTWEAVDDHRVRFRMTVGEETVETTLEVDGEGRPVRATALRWSERAGPGYEPFGVELDGELKADGYTIPSRVSAGWSLGEDDEFRFFEATLDRARFR